MPVVRCEALPAAASPQAHSLWPAPCTWGTEIEHCTSPQKLPHQFFLLIYHEIKAPVNLNTAESSLCLL